MLFYYLSEQWSLSAERTQLRWGSHNTQGVDTSATLGGYFLFLIKVYSCFMSTISSHNVYSDCRWLLQRGVNDWNQVSATVHRFIKLHCSEPGGTLRVENSLKYLICCLLGFLKHELNIQISLHLFISHPSAETFLFPYEHLIFCSMFFALFSLFVIYSSMETNNRNVLHLRLH